MHSKTSVTAASAAHQRVVAASSLGTAIEWYDFFGYALVAPLAFGAVFFPKLNPIAGLITVFSSFAAGFIPRPFGGIRLVISAIGSDASPCFLRRS